MSEGTVFNPDKARRLNDIRRLQTQVDEETLARLLGLQGHEDVADLGSGTGFYTDIVARLTTGRVYAVEFQPEMLAMHRERGLPANVVPVPGDLRRAPLEPESVDVAFSVAVYHEVKGDLGLQALTPALRPPGRLVIVDWRSDPESWESGPPAELRFDGAAVADSLRPSFESVTVENVGRFMFGLVATGVRRDTDDEGAGHGGER